MGTSMPSRDKDQSDFDLEAFIDLFDEALTSDDPSVQKTLQHLMVICALARNHAQHDERNGPMRRMFQDQRDIIRRLERLEIVSDKNRGGFQPGYGPTPPLGPYPTPITTPNTVWPGTIPPYPPGTIWAHSTADLLSKSPMPSLTATQMNQITGGDVSSLLNGGFSDSELDSRKPHFGGGISTAKVE